MKLDLYQVDAFSKTLFKGNPAAVVPLREWLPDHIMQSIALENNLSETAFFVPTPEGYHLRWFTPAVEVDFCGHATLATSHVLFEHLEFPEKQIDFQTRVGKVSVYRSEGGYSMNAPVDELSPLDIPQSLEEALGAEILELFKGREDLLAIIKTKEQVIHLSPDFTALTHLTPRGILVSAPGEEVDFVSRCFFPNAGVDEDPVTGSAHTTMVPYWSKQFGKTELKARQLSVRGGEIHCQLAMDRVILTGSAVTYLKGEIYL